MSVAPRRDVVEILAETIKEQAEAYKDQGIALGQILQALNGIGETNQETRLLLGALKDKAEELHRLRAVGDGAHKNILELLKDIGPAEALSLAELRASVRNGINDSMISILKSKLFWAFAIILLGGFLFMVGVKVLEVGDWIRITAAVDPPEK